MLFGSEDHFIVDEEFAADDKEQYDSHYHIGEGGVDSECVSNFGGAVLKEYNGTAWVIVSASVPQTEQADYENYQRYIDNFNKLKAVQEVLTEKEIQVLIELNSGDSSATAWGCDLTYDYVKINGDYRT